MVGLGKAAASRASMSFMRSGPDGDGVFGSGEGEKQAAGPGVQTTMGAVGA